MVAESHRPHGPVFPIYQCRKRIRDSQLSIYLDYKPIFFIPGKIWLLQRPTCDLSLKLNIVFSLMKFCGISSRKIFDYCKTLKSIVIEFRVCYFSLYSSKASHSPLAATGGAVKDTVFIILSLLN